MWYPADANSLREAVDGYLSSNELVVPNKPIALIVPHAGYTYSGPVAGAMYGTLRGHQYDRVIVLGLSHGTMLRGASVLAVDAYESPLGRTPADMEVRDALLECPVVSEQPAAFRNEHSAENQLPMLQRALGDFEMVEVLVGTMTDDERIELARVVRDLLDENTLLVVSTDFTHYGPNFNYAPFRDRIPERLRILNDGAVREILEVDVPGWEAFLNNTQATICGRHPVALLLETLMPFDDIEGRRLAYATSGELTGDYTNSVTYAGIAFWRIGEGLEESEQRTLLRLARNTVTDYLNRGSTPIVELDEEAITPRIESMGAAFVTLRNENELRGCIGHIIPVAPLYRSVAENAYQACMDPRFVNNPVTSSEVSDLEIEVSVLTPMRRLLDPEEVRVGTDGLVIVRGRNSGVLLPQVPIEQGWDREEFLAGACQKAGLPADAWRNPLTEIYRFSAQVFGEAEHGR
jgi:AmmeMemoRadiSam system protein B/AmmeMemoRadiSam system protein A